MGHQGQIVESQKDLSHSNKESSSETEMSSSASGNTPLADVEAEEVINLMKSRIKSKAKELKSAGGSQDGVRKRGGRYNSFSSSVYEEDARWKALNEERLDRPCHKAEDSPFTTASGFQNFRGLLNWCIIILVFTTGRAALENLIKYGVLINPIPMYHFFLQSPNNFPMVWVFIVLNVVTSIIYLLEKAATKFRLPERLLLFLQCITLFVHITFPAAFVYYVEPSPFLSSPFLSLTVVTFLKMVSYIQVNKWCRLRANQATDHKSSRLTTRSAAKGHKRTPSYKASSTLLRTNDHERFANLSPYQHYPDNLNIKDYLYFLVAPTVCYELNYPRTARIRIRFLVKRALEIFFLLGLILSLIQQWIFPTLENSALLFEKMNYPMMLARVLKLAIANHFIWLISFYFIFHSCCNFQAELLRFADRNFYNDWWNSENLQQFWSTWNIPIHRFARRHVYKRLLEQGRSKIFASLSVFMLSAFFHEYLISIPLNMLRPWFFMSFFLQTPLVMMSDKFSGKGGNMMMWLMLILGQPMAIMMYYHDYYLMHRDR